MRPRRLRDFSYIGVQRYFLTICTHTRRRHFTDAAIVNAVHAEFARTCTYLILPFLAYCYMPGPAIAGVSSRGPAGP